FSCPEAEARRRPKRRIRRKRARRREIAETLFFHPRPRDKNKSHERKSTSLQKPVGRFVATMGGHPAGPRRASVPGFDTGDWRTGGPGGRGVTRNTCPSRSRR